MNRNAAEQIVPMLTNAAAEIAATIDILRGHASEEGVKAYSDAVGRVFFAIDDLLRPIINEYPDLQP